MSDIDPTALLAEFHRRFGGHAFSTLEEMIVSPEGFGLTNATPLQRAICRIIDGQPLEGLLYHTHVQEAVGDCRPINGKRPKHVILISAIRAGKSLITAGAAMRMTQTCDFGMLQLGEVPLVSITSLTKKNAGAIMQHLMGNALAKPALRSLIVGGIGGEAFQVRSPSGRPVGIGIASGSRAGGNLISFWSAGSIFDEAPRMVGAEDGVINLDDARSAVIGRLLPGAAPRERIEQWLAEAAR